MQGYHKPHEDARSDKEDERKTHVKSNFFATRSGRIRICTQKERHDYLAEQCKQIPGHMREGRNDVRLDRLLVDHEHKLIYCVIPKAACTTWKGLLANATSVGYTKRGTKIHWMYPHLVFSKTYLHKTGLDYMGQKDTKLWNTTFRHYKKFLVIRDPMQRILSAYYDKLRDEKPLVPFLRLMKDYFNRTDIVPFSDFVHFLTHPGYDGRYNIHWKTYDRLCSPCDIQYNYILKVETMEHDQNLILPLIGMSKKQSLPKLNISPNSNSTDSHGKQDHFEDYWTLEESELKGLLDRYYIDRNVFGYQYDMQSRRSYCSIKTKEGDTCC